MHKYIVDSCDPISSSAQLITLRLEDGRQALSFRPGQYAAISFFRNNRPTPARCFSLVSSPLDENILQFSMRTNGKFTRAASQLSEGDEVNVRGPFGAFVLDDDVDEPAVLLAGGIGITPFMSMVTYATQRKLTKDITLIYSCKNQDDVPFKDELLALSSQNQHLKIYFLIADGPLEKLKGARVTTGRITDQIMDAAISAEPDTNTNYYICGPPGFMKGMEKLLQYREVPESHVFTEAFSQGPNKQTGKIKSWPYNIYALGGISLVLASFVVMSSDLMKTLPPSTLLKEVVGDDEGLSSRQEDIDKTINELPSAPSSSPASDASVKAAQSASAASSSTASTTTSTPAQTITPAAVSPTPTYKAPACVSTPSAPC